jgi:hypothetical protein
VGGFAIEAGEMSFAVNDCYLALVCGEPNERRGQVRNLR